MAETNAGQFFGVYLFPIFAIMLSDA